MCISKFAGHFIFVLHNFFYIILNFHGHIKGFYKSIKSPVNWIPSWY